MREVEIQNTLFIFLTQQYEEAKINEAKDTPTIQILDIAVKPNIRVRILSGSFNALVIKTAITKKLSNNHQKGIDV